jgi:probable rRNA maturation factor
MPVGYQGPDAYEEWIVVQAGRALAAMALSNVEVSVVLCDDAAIRPLNERWRGKDEVTDVLSFPQMDLQEPLEALPDRPEGAAPTVLGDIVISVDTAARQASALGHPLRGELVVLLVHGLAHLLGHTHSASESSDRMAALEAHVLQTILPGDMGLVARTGGPE